MLRTAQIRSQLFDQVIGRAQPPLPHPTANAFDAAAWTAALAALSEPTQRDLELTLAAVYFNREVANLRAGPIKAAFEGLSADTIIRLAVAESNRGYLITARRLETALAAYAGRDDVLLNARPVVHTGASPLHPDASPDDVNTFIGDTLPHWFHQAATAAAQTTDPKTQLGRAGQIGLASLSLERSLRDLWHDVLWEGFHLKPGDPNDKAPVLTPTSFEEETLWAAWLGRFESLTSVQSYMRAAEVRAGRLAEDGVLERTVTRLVRSGRSVRCRFGPPTINARRYQSLSMDTAESSYLGIFLDEPLTTGDDPVTPRQLMHAWFVVRDMGKLLASEVTRTEIRNARDLNTLSAGLPRQTLWLAIREVMGVSDDKATALLEQLITDATKTSEAFRHGLWHRPLVARPGTDELLLVMPVLLSGAPTRRLERWLIASGKADDLSTGPRGLAYEAHVREVVGEGLAQNKLFTDVASAKDAIARAGKGEEIDAVFRVGKTVLVCEVKCFLVPAESLERYSHIKKLEAAAEQASRKAAWLQTQPNALEAAIGPLPADIADLTFVPLVVLNHGVGLSLDIDGCLVTDLHFLEVYLSHGSYTASNFLTREGAVMASQQVLYASQQEAEDKLRATFAAPPGLRKFMQAVVWREVPVPTSKGGVMRAPAHDIDESKMITPQERAKAARLNAGGKLPDPIVSRIAG